MEGVQLVALVPAKSTRNLRVRCLQLHSDLQVHSCHMMYSRATGGRQLFRNHISYYGKHVGFWLRLHTTTTFKLGAV